MFIHTSFLILFTPLSFPSYPSLNFPSARPRPVLVFVLLKLVKACRNAGNLPGSLYHTLPKAARAQCNSKEALLALLEGEAYFVFIEAYRQFIIEVIAPTAHPATHNAAHNACGGSSGGGDGGDCGSGGLSRGEGEGGCRGARCG